MLEKKPYGDQDVVEIKLKILKSVNADISKAKQQG